MRFSIVLGLAAIAMPLTAATAMPVATFLQKAEALQKKGPLAMFSADLKLLTNQVKKDASELRAANQAAAAANRKKAYCAPDGGVKMGNRDVLAAMNAVAPAARATTDSKDALRAYLARRYPCAG